MTRKRTIIALIVALLAVGAWECGDGSQPECTNGSIKVVAKHGKTTTYHCNDGRWVKQ